MNESTQPIISHKKSLRVSRLTKDRELLLSRYQDDNSNGSVEKSSESVSESIEKPDKPSFKELIQTHNQLLGKEQDTNNLIKSTIYDNYYDLIRVNKSLEQFIDPQGDINIMWDKLTENML
ncbi:vacuolar protein sorting-associated protein 51 [Monosporozyma unispora]|nr:hypothetical protein C6P44_005009 [Kazachstania unispora]